LHIANAKGFDGGDFASLGEARLALDLWPLLHLQLHIEDLSGSHVHIRLQMNKDGSNNWKFTYPNNKTEVANLSSSPQANTMELGNLLSRLDIKQLSLENLDIEFIDTGAKSHFFELQSLAAQFPTGQPVKLALRGTIEKKFPYKVDLTGGTLAELAHFDQPWPFELTLGFMNSSLSLNGKLTKNSADIHFSLGTENLNEFERLLQTRLPAVGKTVLSGNIQYAPGNIAVTHLSGAMGQSTLNGTLNYIFSGERPKIQGELSLPVLDLRPFLSAQPVEKSTPSPSLSALYQEIAKASFDLKQLNSMDANLTLRVGQWLNLPGAVHDAMLQIKLEQGQLAIPVQATVADVKLSGSASADASVKPSRFKLALGTQNSSLGNLAGLLFGMPDIQGTLGRFSLDVAARGDRGSELMESLEVKLKLQQGKLSYGNRTGERPVQFSLDHLTVDLPAGKSLRGDAQGSLLNKSFSGKLQGGPLMEIMQEAQSPLDFEIQAGSAKAQVHAVLQPSAWEMKFELSALHSGEIASWLGLKPGADAPISLKGNFQTDHAAWHLADFALKLGRSELTADVLRTFEKGKALIKVQLSGEQLDADEIQSLLPESATEPSQATASAANLIDIPILPSSINLDDADIEVRIKHIATRSPLTIRDLRFDGVIREGMMSTSPFAANVAGSEFNGAILLDFRTLQPHSVLWLSADSINIGSILSKLGISNTIDAGVDHVVLQLDLHSSHLGQLLAQSEIAVNFKGGHLTLKDANTGGKVMIALNSGELKSAAGAPVHLDLLGSLDTIPVVIGIQTARAIDLINPNLPIPFNLAANTAGATIKLSGNVDRPLTKKDIELALDMSGNRMDNLNSLLHASLPPWGPWSASGRFHMSSSGYEVSSLILKIGSSQLSGMGKVNMQAVPPRIDIALTAPSIQLDDFRFGDWSPEKTKPAAIVKPPAKPEDAPQTNLSQKAGKAGAQVQQILSPEVLRRQNAYLSVRVDQVVSGKDLLGSGILEARLVDGRAAIGPVVVNMPGGSASLSMGYEPGEKDVAVNLRAEVKHFEYGVLARHLDNKSEMRGIFSLDVDVSARAQYLSELLRNGKGVINFSVWPENLKSGLLDIWAVNALMALLPAVDSSNASKVNCAIGRFVLNEGKLTEKNFLIDTSRMRVTGKGSVDFAAEDIRLLVKPRAKNPQFLSFAIPLELRGNFNDFHISVSPLDVLGTVGQLATSVVWVPMQMIINKAPPADGHDVCVD
jgi:uncharacterized protein involved in outer membrane biogenesis